MRKIINLLGVFYLFLVMFSCSNDIANDVYSKPETPTETKKASLTVALQNAEEGKNYFVGALKESPFDELGESGEITDQSFVVRESVVNGQAVFGDLMSHYKSTLFFNLFEVEGENNQYKLVSHLGNQLLYQVALGSFKKKIDLSITPPVIANKTVINITVDAIYNNKVLYLVKQGMQTVVEAKLQAAAELTEDMYLEKVVSADGKAQITIYSPHEQTTFLLYLAAPLDKVPFMKKTLEIDYETAVIASSFQQLPRKVINVSAIYNKLPKAREVYLLTEQSWTNTVKSYVAGNRAPQPNTYIELKTTAAAGNTSFEIVIPEGGQTKYVVYVPKWKTNSYADYKIETITIVSNTDTYDIKITEDDAPIPPPVGNKVKFQILVDASLILYGGDYNYVYAVESASEFKAAWNLAINGKGSQIKLRSVIPVLAAGYNAIINDVEVSPDKEIVIFMVAKRGVAPDAAVLRIKGSDVTSNPYRATLKTIEPQ